MSQRSVAWSRTAATNSDKWSRAMYDSTMAGSKPWGWEAARSERQTCRSSWMTSTSCPATLSAKVYMS